MTDFPEKIHCLGVGGIGLSGVAAILSSYGHEVSGCDEKLSPDMRMWLERHGVKVDLCHAKEHVAKYDPELIIRSPAVNDASEEIVLAREKGISVIRRGEALARIVGALPTIAVCGTHGKTTTSSFTATLLQEAGIAGTGWCIGGFTASMGGVAKVPKAGAPFVVEADESDGTLALYSPKVLVLTSIDADHMEHFASFEDLKGCFAKAVGQTADAVVYCAESVCATEVAMAHRNAVSYGFCEAARLRGVNVTLSDSGSSFDVIYDGVLLGRAEIGVPGVHNVLNALAAMGALIAYGVDVKAAFGVLAAIKELPHRRFERVRLGCGAEVVSDYSHHPVEIKALIETARLFKAKRLRVVFQPHRYTRTRALINNFPAAFDGCDELILLPVYAASEEPLEGGTTADLYARMREVCGAVVPMLARSVKEVADYYASPMGALRDGDILLVVGAGDIVSLVGELTARCTEAIEERSDSEVDLRVSYGMRLCADSSCEVADEGALCELLAKGVRPLNLFGMGTNLLPPPLGVRGSVVRLVNRDLTIGADGTVECGAGLSGAALLARLRDAGLSGLEFMAGIPGTVGGWLAMNAGTRFGAIGDRVVSCVVYTKDGERIVSAKDDCGFGYRTAAFFDDKVIWSVVLKLESSTPEAIAERMAEYSAKRFDFTGLRTAGSVFKNPDGDSAGRLAEAAGCKGLRVGGAYVCERHANIISADEGATPSDVMALIEIVQSMVFAQSGILLKKEVRIW